ncbi:MAG: acetyltransferase [Lactobacillales bacterium]|jgi:sugar O-acyltransferase (sialic acid O-acetyltransferase NeuD family)|nr:acetyltransferase [Lactobacillales bacterium]
MENILIYGISQEAQQIKYYLDLEKQKKVVAFVVDRDYMKTKTLLGLPVIEFENITQVYPQDKYSIIISFGYKNMVRNRQKKFEQVRNLGYKILSFISNKAHVFTDEVGEGTIIFPGVVIEPFVRIGKGNFFESSVTIAHHSQIGNFNYFSPGATVCGDTNIKDNCFLGAGSVVGNSLTMEPLTCVGAGCTITKSTNEYDAYRYGKNNLSLKRTNTGGGV